MRKHNFRIGFPEIFVLAQPGLAVPQALDFALPALHQNYRGFEAR